MQLLTMLKHHVLSLGDVLVNMGSISDLKKSEIKTFIIKINA